MREKMFLQFDSTFTSDLNTTGHRVQIRQKKLDVLVETYKSEN